MNAKRTSILSISILLTVMLISGMSMNTGIPNGDSGIKTNSHTSTIDNDVVFLKHNSFFSPSDGFSELSNHFESLGLDVVDLNAEPTAEDLDNALIIVISSYFVSDYSPEAISVIENYVANGGNAIFAGESGGVDLGIETFGNIASSGAETADFILPHPATHNVTDVYIPSGLVVTDFSISGSAQFNINTTDSSDTSDHPVILTNRYGDGNVLATTISNIWTGIRFSGGNNSLIISNFVDMIEDENKKLTFGLHNSFFAPDDGFFEFSTVFTGNNFIIDDHNAQIRSGDLNDTDILVLSGYFAPNYDTTSIQIIEDYTSNGGNVIFAGESGGVDLGIETFGNIASSGAETADFILPHPATHNVTDVYIPSGLVVTDFSISGSAQFNINTTDSSDTPDHPVILTNRYGDGNVLATTISNLWTQTRLLQANNSLILENFIDMIYDENKKLTFGLHNSFFAPDDGFFEFSKVFTGNNFIIDDHNDQIRSGDLNDTDILVLSGYFAPNYDTTSIQIIEDYTSNGGDVIFAGESGGVDLGIETFGNIASSGAETADFILPHPATHNVTDVYIPSGLVVTDFSISGSAQFNINTTDSSDTPDHPVILTNRYGDGNVLATTISNLWTQTRLLQANNSLILENFIDMIRADTNQLTFPQHNSFFAPDNGLYQLSNYFAGQNFVINDFNANPTSSVLATTDILIINTYYSYGFSSTSQQAIKEYVENGGGVLILGYGGDDLDLGVQVTDTSVFADLFNPVQVVDHPLFLNTNVSDITVPGNDGLSAYEIWDSAQVVAQSSSNSDHANYPLLIENHMGSGHVLASTVANIWSNSYINIAGKQILNNFINIVLGNSPYENPVVNSPMDQSLSKGDTLQISWNGDSEVPYKFEINGSSVQVEGDWNGRSDVVLTLNDMQPGSYNYTISLIDEYDNSVSDTVSVEVSGTVDEPGTTTITDNTTITVNGDGNGDSSQLPYPIIGLTVLLVIPVIYRRFREQ